MVMYYVKIIVVHKEESFKKYVFWLYRFSFLLSPNFFSSHVSQIIPSKLLTDDYITIIIRESKTFNDCYDACSIRIENINVSMKDFYFSARFTFESNMSNIISFSKRIDQFRRRIVLIVGVGEGKKIIIIIWIIFLCLRL